MKNLYKIIVQLIISVFCGIVFGIIGLILGSYIGGNFGFPAFNGLGGYEAGGVVFAITGISLGSLLGTTFINKQKSTNALKVSIITAFIGLMLFDYDMSLFTQWIILFLPPLALTLITNKEKIDTW